jgi:hypothetical protein
MWSLEYLSSLQDVCRFIDGMPCYYICEFPALSRMWMQRAFGIGDIPVENTTHGEELVNVESLDGSTFDLVCRKNALDLALYRHAVDRMLRLNFGDIDADRESVSRLDPRLQPARDPC